MPAATSAMRQPIKMRGRRRPGAWPNSNQAIVAAGYFSPLKGDGPDDLRKGERQHREIDARQPHAEPAEDKGSEDSEQRSGHEPGRHRQVELLQRQSRAVSAQAEIGGMAERDQAAGADKQMQACRKQHENQDFARDRQQIVAGDQRQQRGRGNSDYDEQPVAPSKRTPAHDLQTACRAGRRLGAAEQAPGPHHQHQRHDQEYENEGDFRKYQDAKGVQLRDDDRGEERAEDIAEAADHYHHQHFGDDLQIHGVADRFARQFERAAERGEERFPAQTRW